MSEGQGWDRARWLWGLALVGGISFFVAVHQHWDDPAIHLWKTSGVALLAVWAAVNARNGDGRLIASVLGFGALGDWALDAIGLMQGAAAFALQSVARIAARLEGLVVEIQKRFVDVALRLRHAGIDKSSKRTTEKPISCHLSLL